MHNGRPARPSPGSPVLRMRPTFAPSPAAPSLRAPAAKPHPLPASTLSNPAEGQQTREGSGPLVNRLSRVARLGKAPARALSELRAAGWGPLVLSIAELARPHLSPPPLGASSRALASPSCFPEELRGLACRLRRVSSFVCQQSAGILVHVFLRVTLS